MECSFQSLVAVGFPFLHAKCMVRFSFRATCWHGFFILLLVSWLKWVFSYQQLAGMSFPFQQSHFRLFFWLPAFLQGQEAYVLDYNIGWRGIALFWITLILNLGMTPLQCPLFGGLGTVVTAETITANGLFKQQGVGVTWTNRLGSNLGNGAAAEKN